MHCVGRGHSSYLVNSGSEVKESNDLQKESYDAKWLDLVMETRPEYKTVLTERDSIRNESFERKQVVHFVVRRSPKQTIHMGRDGSPLHEYQLPYGKGLPMAIFVPRNMAAKAKQEFSPSELQSIMEFERASASGVCSEKREVSSITKDIPWVTQPRRPEFQVSRLISSATEPSQDSQQR